MERIYGRNVVCQNALCSTRIQFRLESRRMTEKERKRRNKQLVVAGGFRKENAIHPMQDPPRRVTKAFLEGKEIWLCDNCYAKLKIRTEPTKAELQAETKDLVAEYFKKGRTVKRV